MTAPIPLPPTPWLRSAAVAQAPTISDSDGHLLAVVLGDRPEVGDLIALAPELLADLAALLRALMLLDQDYRQEHFPDMHGEEAKEAVIDAASNAVATLSYAAHCRLPVDMPGLDQLEDAL
jgi:hypothetical protein